MARKHLKGFSIEKGNIKIKVDMKAAEEALARAQFELDGAIMNSMIPLMPMQNGTFIQLTRARSASVQGTGRVYAGIGPQGRMLYEGKVMVDPVTKSPWARPGAKKVVTNKEINFNKLANPNAQKEWFLAAKKKDLKKWVDIAQNAVKE